jgi:transglutaminase-like putative cysteine protease
VAATAAVTGDEALDVSPFVPSSPLVDVEPLHRELAALTADAFPPGSDLVTGVRDLCHTIYTGFAFDPSFSDVSTPLVTVLEAGRGVCQDFAHLGVACLRSLGLAARYVSGYIETEPPEGEERLIGADASHAWFSVWVPGWGWLDVDPTNDHVPPARHVTVAWGRDYADVTPVRGVVIGPAATQELSVSVDVQRVSP